MKTSALSIGAMAALSTVSVASADIINITIENTNNTGGFFFTPFWVAAHNGGFDSYDGGTFAGAWPGLEEIAEEGDTGPLGAAFTASAAGIAGGVQTTITAISGGGDAPVFSPGESSSFALDVGDPTLNRYFSYASMVIPSNDLFVANGNPFSHQIFNAAGDFLGPVTIEIYGGDVNDAGTELNDAFGGAAFSDNGGTSTDENELIRAFFTGAGDVDYLESFLGTQTITGDTISSTFGQGQLIARLTITPAPGALALFGVFGVATRRRRRR